MERIDEVGMVFERGREMMKITEGVWTSSDRRLHIRFTEGHDDDGGLNNNCKTKTDYGDIWMDKGIELILLRLWSS